MNAHWNHDGHLYALTTDHAASSYGEPVLLIDDQLTDVVVSYEADGCLCTILSLLADARGIWAGRQTRWELAQLAAEMLPEHPREADYDAVIDAFLARQDRD